LPSTVPRADAVFNIGHTALLVASLVAGRADLLAEATADRLHQPARLQASPASARAVAHLRQAGAMAGWLSGSGPTVVALCAPDRLQRVLADPPVDGHLKLLDIDHDGTRVHPW
jgi:homoserine kinase